MATKLTGINRRHFLASTAATGLVATGGSLFMPNLSRAADRPMITHGLQSGDVSGNRAIIWARADREARMLTEIATNPDFTDARMLPHLDVSEATDLAGKLELTDLPMGSDVYYRVRFEDLSMPGSEGEAMVGHLRTPSTEKKTVTFGWSGDTAGQGWGIDLDRGGMQTYKTMQAHDFDFFIHSGDTVYCDGPISSEKKMPNGEIWKNVTTEEKSKVAETLTEFRGNWKYNMLDEHVKAFNAAVPVFYQWDDHEVLNNWYPGEMLDGDDRYKVKSASLLAARSNRAFLEMTPIRPNIAEPGRVYRKVSYGPMIDIFFLDMRTYRNANSKNQDASPVSFLGNEQVAWLKKALKESKATWKIMASDMPIGLVVGDGDNFENMANGDGKAAGRELEFADLLKFIKDADIKNTVWFTADVHYTAAHYYDPAKAQFQDFAPFWEFVSGPLHAGTFGPNGKDNTFGIQVMYEKAPTKEQGVNLPPSDGLQFFGKVIIDGESEAMTVELRDMADAVLYSTTLQPEKA
ncbi:MAG: alkaline phosphatase [Hyphomicrobiales bacterium]|nr:MAG: alkaline phosphatase [Hyphomicrobiales bacterium]